MDTERLSGEHCRLQRLAYRRTAHSTASSPIIGQFNGTADAQLGAKDGHARPRPRWFGDIHRMNPQSNVTASTLALSTATMAPIAMKTVPRLAKRRPDSLFAVIFV